MLPPFSKVSGSAPFSKGHVSFLAPFFKGFWKCPLFQGSCQLFGTLFQRFLKGHVSFLAPFFQRFLEVLPSPKVMSAFWHLFFKGFWKCFLFQGSCQLFAPFLKGFWMCFLFQGSCQFFQKLTVTSLPFFKGLLLLGFPKFPFPRSFFKVSPFFKGFLKCFLFHMALFPKVDQCVHKCPLFSKVCL